MARKRIVDEMSLSLVRLCSWILVRPDDQFGELVEA